MKLVLILSAKRKLIVIKPHPFMGCSSKSTFQAYLCLSYTLLHQWPPATIYLLTPVSSVSSVLLLSSISLLFISIPSHLRQCMQAKHNKAPIWPCFLRSAVVYDPISFRFLHNYFWVVSINTSTHIYHSNINSTPIHNVIWSRHVYNYKADVDERFTINLLPHFDTQSHPHEAT